MDYSDGEVRFKSYLRCSEGVPLLSDVEFVVDMSFVMFDRYENGLVKCLMGFGDPETDVEAAEK